jgi:hypothetical protein
MKLDFIVMKSIIFENGFSLARLESLEKVVRAGTIALVAQGVPNDESKLSRQITELE